MADDSDSADKPKQVDDRLNHLESIARDTNARLYEIEKRLGLLFTAVPREIDQSARIEREDRLSPLRAAEEGLKSTTRSQKPGAQGEPHATDQQRDTPSKGEQTPSHRVERVPDQNAPIGKPAKPLQPITAVPPVPSEHAPVATPPSAVFSEPSAAKTPPTGLHPITTAAKAPPTALHPVGPATRAEQMRPTQTLPIMFDCLDPRSGSA